MNKRALHRSLAVLAVAGLLAAACSDDDDDGDSGAATSAPAGDTEPPGTTGVTSEATSAPSTAPTESAPTSEGGAAVDLATVCPETIVIQTDWFPEAEHGALYQMVGEGYTVDAGDKIVSGPLVSGGEETGVMIEVRAGGPAIGGSTVAATTYADDSITLAYANTESQVLQHADTPLVSVVAPLELNPQIIYWDPETYPDVETLADLGTENITINVFGGGVFSEVFVAQGIWNADQVDPSYDGSPSRFIAEDGGIAQQGFASAEPYKYEVDFTDWGKPLEYQLLHDAGFEVYSQTLAARPDDVEELGPCFELFVPIVQQAAIDYLADPAAANAIIIDAVTQYDTFWTYDEGVAEFSVATQEELGLVGNGDDDTLGNMDEARIQGVIDQMSEASMDVPADLVAADLFTNDYIDPDIGM